MKYKLCLFDFDYTLADTTKPIVESFRHTFKTMNLEGFDREKAIKTIGLTLDDAFQKLTGINDKERVEELVEIYRLKSDEITIQNTILYEDTIETLKTLKKNNVKIGIVSSRMGSRIDKILEYLNCREYIDNIIGYEHVSIHKPDPEGLLKSLNHFKCEKEEVLYVGDSYIDAKAAENGKIDFADKTVTENTRVSYPIDHSENIASKVNGVSSGPAAKNVIFLSADAFGVLPPVSVLTPEQTQYYFLSGFTAKLAGTKRGITEPTPTFSACFGQAFLELHPTKYAEELVKKMEKSGAKAYLVNTGWNGTGKRISIKDTRGIIDAILNGDIQNAPTKTIPYFNFEVPTELPGVDSNILDPRDTYQDVSQWEEKAKDLASRFNKNFVKYTTNEAGKALVKAGPQL